MSYLKLPKTCSDHAVGFQSVNQAIDNNIELYTQLDRRHAVTAEGNSYVPPFRAPGSHDDELIARTVADFAFSSGLLIMVPYITGPMIFGLPVLVKTGQWDIPITAPRIYSAVATIKGASTGGPRGTSCKIWRWINATPYVTVTTWDINGGALADYDFSLAIWTPSLT